MDEPNMRVVVVGPLANKELPGIEQALGPAGFSVARARALEAVPDADVVLVDATTAMLGREGLTALRDRGAAVVGYGPQRDDVLEGSAWLSCPFRPDAAADELRTALAAVDNARATLDAVVRGGPLIPGHGLEILATLARARLSGDLVFSSATTRFTITLSRGVVTGALDDGVEHRLLGRMVRAKTIDEEVVPRALEYARAHKIRAAEALLALGACTGRELVAALRSQRLARVVAAVSLDEGSYGFTPRDDDAARGGSAVGLFEVAAHTADASVGKPHVGAWFAAHRAERFAKGPAAEAAARARSWLPLPGFEEALTRADSLAGVVALVRAEAGPASSVRAVARLWSLFALGALAFEGEPLPEELPGDPPSVTGAAAAIAETLFDTWVRAEGRDLFEFLGLPRGASTDQIRVAFDALNARLGRAALSGVELGDAERAATELWQKLEDVEDWLLDPDRRGIYIEELERLEPDFEIDVDHGQAIEAEGLLRGARAARGREDLDEAARLLDRARGLVPNHLEVAQLQAWVAHQRGDRSDPTGARAAALALARTERERGDTLAASAYLREASAAFPGDAEVERTQSSLGVAEENNLAALIDEVLASG